MPVHRIRLREPWEALHVGEAGPARRIRLVGDWDDLSRRLPGRYELTRLFHSPTNLGPGDRVQLVISQPRGVQGAAVNGHRLEEAAGDPHTRRWDITAWLEPVNRLTIDVVLESLQGHAGGSVPWGEVVLEIVSGG